MKIDKLVNLLIPADANLVCGMVDGRFHMNPPIAKIDNGVDAIEIIDSSVHHHIITELSNYYMAEIATQSELYNGMVENTNEALIETLKILIKEREQYKRAVEENVRYKLYYGQPESPLSILNQLYRKQKKELSVLLPQNAWQKYAYTDGAKYWLEMFEYWKVIKIEPNYRYFSLMSWNKAKAFIFMATATNEDSFDVMIREEYRKDNIKLNKEEK